MSKRLDPLKRVDGGIRIRIRLVPKSSRDAVEGLEDTAEGPALKARVRAVPEDGRANAAAERLVAEWLGVPRSAVSLVAGQKSRVKVLEIVGDPASLAGLVEARVGQGSIGQASIGHESAGQGQMRRKP